jgi:hypothetical protein
VSQLFLLVLAVLMFFVIRKYLRHRADQQLRENPPARRVIEVSLPRGVEDSDERMTRFYRKVASAALGDKDMRKQGMRQIDIIYLAEARRQGSLPEMRFLVYCDPDKMDAVKRALKNAFSEQADVLELPPEHDPMRELTMLMHPNAGKESEQLALPPVPE